MPVKRTTKIPVIFCYPLPEHYHIVQASIRSSAPSLPTVKRTHIAQAAITGKGSAPSAG